MIANTLSLAQLVASQQGTWFGVIPKWNIFLQPVAFFVYFCSAVAERTDAI
jgi:NADH:ubiquinone oxidoreductase subunit H